MTSGRTEAILPLDGPRRSASELGVPFQKRVGVVRDFNPFTASNARSFRVLGSVMCSTWHRYPHINELLSLGFHCR